MINLGFPPVLGRFYRYMLVESTELQQGRIVLMLTKKGEGIFYLGSGFAVLIHELGITSDAQTCTLPLAIFLVILTTLIVGVRKEKHKE